MRRILTALLLLGALTACSAQPAGSPAPSAPDSPSAAPEASPAATPTEHWWADLTAEDLPAEVTDAADVVAGSGEVYLLSELPEEDISLYGYGSDTLTGVLLRRGEDLTHLDQPYLATENPAAPELWWDDFDGDGENELAVLYLLVNHAQQHLVQLHFYSPDGAGWQDQPLDLDAQVEALLADMTCTFDTDSGMVQVTCGALSTSAYLEELDAPLSADPLSAGESVFFRRSGTAITAVLPLSLNSSGQSMVFANAICSLTFGADGPALTLEALETLYGA